jgi:hypothetical protein
MPLEPQENEIALTLGMDTSQSDDLAEPTHMRLVENLHWRRRGELEKRPVHGVSETIVAAPDSLYAESDSCGLVSHDGTPVVVTGGHGIAAYSEEISDVVYGRARTTIASGDDDLNYCPVSYEVSRRFIDRAQSNKLDAGIFSVASAQHDGIHVIAWITNGSTPRLLCKAIDVDSGQVLAHVEYDNLVSSAFMVQACEYTESGKEGVLIAYVDDSSSPYTISTIRYNAATNAFVTDSALATTATNTFAIVKNGNRIYCAYNDNSTGFLTVDDRTLGAAPVSTHVATHSAIGVDIVVGTDTLIASCTTSKVYTEQFGAPADVVELLTASSETYYKVTAAAQSLSGSSDDAVVYATSVTSTSPTSTRVTAREVNFGSAITQPGTTSYLPHCVTVANAFTLRGFAHVVLAVYTKVDGDDAAYVNAERPSPTSCFVARYRAGTGGWARHDAVAKLCHDRFFVTNHLSFDPGGLGLGKQGSSVYVDSANNAWLALTADPSPATSVAGYHYPQTIFLERISAARPMPVPYAHPEPGITLVAGALPWQFDGNMPSECTALVPPVAVVDLPGAGSFTGTYSFIPVYTWTDAAGRLHRMPGNAVSTSPTADQIDVYVSVCPMRSYGYTSASPDMEPELYVTTTGGSVYNLLLDAGGSGNKAVYSSITSDGLWYKFTNALPGNNATGPYPFGSSPLELPPEPPPAFLHVARVLDRMWAIDAEDRSRVWYSKPLVAGYGVEWCVANTLTVGDECTAVVDMAGGALILARGGLYVVSGEGPDATGSTGSFSPAVKLNHTVDCIDPVSVCRVPQGVVFRGRRGFYLFNGQDAVPWAVPIDPEVLTDPLLDPSTSNSYRMRTVYQEQTSEIQICGAPGSVGGTNGHRLVYNLFEDKWSRYASTGVEVHDLAVARGKLWALSEISSASVLRDELLYSRSGVSYNSDADTPCQISTPWYRLDKVAGMARLWRAWFALKLPSDVADLNTVTLSYYVDDSDTLAQQVSWTGAELAATYSTTGVVASLPFVPMNELQVVRSFRFTLAWTFTSASSGPKPLSMRLRFGVRPSLNKRNRLPAKG